MAKTALNSGGITKLGTRRKAAWVVVLFWIPFSGNAVSGGKGESFLQLRWQKAGCLLTDCSKKAVSATPWAVVAIVATATPNIYFKPRAISTHSLYMLLVAFFHTQEARDVGREEPATKAQHTVVDLSNFIVIRNLHVIKRNLPNERSIILFNIAAKLPWFDKLILIECKLKTTVKFIKTNTVQCRDEQEEEAKLLLPHWYSGLDFTSSSSCCAAVYAPRLTVEVEKCNLTSRVCG